MHSGSTSEPLGELDKAKSSYPHHVVIQVELLITLIKVSILPPQKFIEALFFVQNKFEGIRQSFTMIRGNKNHQNSVGLQIFSKG